MVKLFNRLLSLLIIFVLVITNFNLKANAYGNEENNKVEVKEATTNTTQNDLRDTLRDDNQKGEDSGEKVVNENPSTEKVIEEIDVPSVDLNSETKVEQNLDELLTIVKIVDGIEISVSAPRRILNDATSISAIRIIDNAKYLETLKNDLSVVLEDYYFFDINLLDDENEIVQPSGVLEVSIKNLNLSLDEDALGVFHVADTKETSKKKSNNEKTVEIPQETEEIDLKVDNDTVSFNTDHFSIYAIGKLVTHTYDFIVDDKVFDTQIIKNGEQLKEPKISFNQNGKRFIGWSHENTNEIVDFSDTITVVKNETSRIIGNFSETFAVQFVYDNKVVANKSIAYGEKTSDEHVSIYSVMDESDYFRYWSLTENGEPYDFNNSIISDIKLYAVIDKKWKVNFDTQGGSTYFPKYYENKSVFGEHEIPQRQGYTFVGWNLKADGSGDKVDSSTIITSNMRLFAMWRPEDVNYTIVRWLENADDDNYSFGNSETKTGKSGSVIQLQEFDYQLEGNQKFKDYKHFTYLPEKTEHNHLINGDGSTVVNLYYSRNKYTIRFNLWWAQTYIYPYLMPGYLNPSYENPYININGETYYTNYTITAKYKSDISSLWPSLRNISTARLFPYYPYNPTETFYFKGWVDNKSLKKVSKRYTFTEDLFSVNEIKDYYGQWNSNPFSEIYTYYFEALDHEVGHRMENSKEYVKIENLTQIVPSLGNGAIAKEIDGVEALQKNPVYLDYDFSTGLRVNGFFYNRKKYKFHVVNSDLKEEHYIKFGERLDSFNITPRQPESFSQDKKQYIFSGWYTTPEGYAGTEFDFTTTTMPSQELSIYAKWEAPKHTLKYYQSSEKIKSNTITEIDHLGRISPEQLTGKIVPHGLNESDFKGWYWCSDDQFIPFDFKTEITLDDIVLFPVWNGRSTSIKYDLNGGIGEVPKDTLQYLVGTAAIIADVGDTQAPHENQQFIGWKDTKTGVVYYPGNLVIMNENVSLLAQWGDKSSLTSIVYDSNGGLDKDNSTTIVINDLLNNSANVVKENTFTRMGYIFESWNTEADGTGTDYYPFEKVILDDTKGQNTLYAQWKINKYEITYIAGSNGTIIGEHTQVVPYGLNSKEVSAIPNHGYKFVSWSDGKTEAARTDLNITNNASYTAHFEKDELKWHTVRFESSDHGTLEGDLEFRDILEGSAWSDSITVPTPVAEDGYEFTGWSTEFPKVVGSTATYIANFEPKSTIEYRIEYLDTNNKALHDSETIGSQIMASHVKAEALDIKGYTVDKAIKTLTLAAEGNVITFIYTENEAIRINYSVEGQGSVSVTEEVLAPISDNAEGSIANADFGYTFVKWTNSKGETVGTESQFKPMRNIDNLNEAGEYIAHFEKDTSKWHTVRFESSDHGTLEGDLEFRDILEGSAWSDSITVPTPVADAGYEFTGWSTEFSKVVESTATYIANFATRKDTKYVVEHYLESIEEGVYSLDSTEEKTGETDQYSEATSKEYVGFTVKEIQQSVISGDGTTVVRVEYERNIYTLKYQITGNVIRNNWEETKLDSGYGFGFSGNIKNDPIQGDDDSINDIEYYDTHDFRFQEKVQSIDIPVKKGYHFVGWDGVPDTMPADTVIALGHYEANTDIVYTVEYKDDKGIRLLEDKVVKNKTMNSMVFEFSEIIDGYTCDIPYIHRSLLAEDNVFTFTYKENEAIHINYSVEGQGSVSVTEEVLAPVSDNAEGSIANADFGYSFVKWTNSKGETVGTESQFKPMRNIDNLNEAGEYIAHFEKDTSKWHTVRFESSDHGTLEGDLEFRDILEGSAWSDSITVPTPVADASYEFTGWSTEFPKVVGSTATYIANFVPKSDTKYTVEHYLANLDGEYENTPIHIEDKSGTTGFLTNAEEKSFVGYSVDNLEQLPILGDGSTVVKVTYKRNLYTLEYQIIGEYDANKNYAHEEYKFGEPIDYLEAPTKEGYSFLGWTKSEVTMPNNNVVVTGYFELIKTETPSTETEEIVEETPSTETEEKVEETPSTETEEKVEKTPSTETEEKVEKTPSTETEEKVEETPSTETEEKVEETPSTETKEKVEETPSTETEEKVEETPSTETEEKVEKTPSKVNDDNIVKLPATGQGNLLGLSLLIVIVGFLMSIVSKIRKRFTYQ